MALYLYLCICICVCASDVDVDFDFFTEVLPHSTWEMQMPSGTDWRRKIEFKWGRDRREWGEWERRRNKQRRRFVSRVHTKFNLHYLFPHGLCLESRCFPFPFLELLLLLNFLQLLPYLLFSCCVSSIFAAVCFVFALTFDMFSLVSWQLLLLRLLHLVAVFIRGVDSCHAPNFILSKSQVARHMPSICSCQLQLQP